MQNPLISENKYHIRVFIAISSWTIIDADFCNCICYFFYTPFHLYCRNLCLSDVSRYSFFVHWHHCCPLPTTVARRPSPTDPLHHSVAVTTHHAFYRHRNAIVGYNLFRVFVIVWSTTLSKWWVHIVVFHPFESPWVSYGMAFGLVLFPRNSTSIINPVTPSVRMDPFCRVDLRPMLWLGVLLIVMSLCLFSVFGHSWKVSAHFAYPQYEHRWQT